MHRQRRLWWWRDSRCPSTCEYSIAVTALAWSAEAIIYRRRHQVVSSQLCTRKCPISCTSEQLQIRRFSFFGTVPEVYLDTLGVVLLFVWLACFLCLVEGSTLIETMEGLPGQEIFQPCYRLTLCASSTYPILCTPEQVIVTSIVPSDFPAAISCHLSMRG